MHLDESRTYEKLSNNSIKLIPRLVTAFAMKCEVIQAINQGKARAKPVTAYAGR